MKLEDAPRRPSSGRSSTSKRPKARRTIEKSTRLGLDMHLLALRVARELRAEDALAMASLRAEILAALSKIRPNESAQRVKLQTFMELLETRPDGGEAAVRRDGYKWAILSELSTHRDRALGQTPLAKAVFPGAAPTSAASMLSRKLKELEEEGFVERVRKGKVANVRLAARGESLFAPSSNSAERERGLLNDDIPKVLDFIGEELHWSDRTRFHLAAGALVTATELLHRSRWTTRDTVFAQLLREILLKGRRYESDRLVFDSVASGLSDSEPRRKLIECAVEFQRDEKRHEMLVPIMDVGRSLDATDPALLIWAPMAVSIATRSGGSRSEHRWRESSLNEIHDKLRDLTSISATHWSAASLRVFGAVDDSLKIWDAMRSTIAPASAPVSVPESVPPQRPTTEEVVNKVLSQLPGAAQWNGLIVRWERIANQVLRPFLRAAGQPLTWLDGVMSRSAAHSALEWLSSARLDRVPSILRSESPRELFTIQEQMKALNGAAGGAAKTSTDYEQGTEIRMNIVHAVSGEGDPAPRKRQKITRAQLLRAMLDNQFHLSSVLVLASVRGIAPAEQ